jgi:hypothetical protein
MPPVSGHVAVRLQRTSSRGVLYRLPENPDGLLTIFRQPLSAGYGGLRQGNPAKATKKQHWRLIALPWRAVLV